MLVTLCVAGLFSALVAAGVTMAMGAGIEAAATAGTLSLLLIVTEMVPLILPNPTVPSKFGNAVLGGTMLHTCATLGAGLLVTLLTDFDRQGFLLGLIAGAVVLLAAQVWFGISVLKRAQATTAGGPSNEKDR